MPLLGTIQRGDDVRSHFMKYKKEPYLEATSWNVDKERLEGVLLGSHCKVLNISQHSNNRDTFKRGWHQKGIIPKTEFGKQN